MSQNNFLACNEMIGVSADYCNAVYAVGSAEM